MDKADIIASLKREEAATIRLIEYWVDKKMEAADKIINYSNQLAQINRELAHNGYNA